MGILHNIVWALKQKHETIILFKLLRNFINSEVNATYFNFISRCKGPRFMEYQF